MLNEIWKDITDYEGYYKVSNLGKIKRCARIQIRTDYRSGKNKPYPYKEKIISQHVKQNGYIKVTLYKDKTYQNLHVHRLVAQHFVQNPNNLPQVNHIDGDKSNNQDSNLEWVSISQNKQHAYDTGLKRKGENHVQSKLSNEDVKFIREYCKPFDPELGVHALAKKFGVSPGHITAIRKGTKRVD